MDDILIEQCSIIKIKIKIDRDNVNKIVENISLA